MRTFKHFPKESICPICNTNDDKECILIAIAEKIEHGENCVQSHPFHLDCVIKNLVFHETLSIIAYKF